MSESDEQSGGTGDRYAGGIDLDLGGLDNPADSLKKAIQADDPDKAIGALRLMEAGGQSVELSPEEGFTLAGWLVQAEMYLEAARTYRQAAERDLKHAEAPGAIFKAACLLLGPAHRPEPGIDMLLYLAGNYPDHEHVELAERIIERHQEGDQAGLLQCLSETGLLPQAHAPAAAATADDQPTEDAVPPDEHQRKLRTGRMLSRAIGVTFLVVLAPFVFSLFARDRYRAVDRIDPALLAPPRQKPVSQPRLIRFTRNDHHFQLHPKYDYEISGLIVSKNDYTFLGLSRGSLLYLMDLCLIWGNNVKNKVYKNPNLEFVQHGNVCYTQWKGRVRFNGQELSNNHIILSDDLLEDAFDDLGEGDQIRMRGQLVDVRVQPVDPRSREAVRGTFKSSTRRDDDGMGACEIIQVTDLEVLNPASPLWRLLNRITFWLLVALAVAFVCRLVFFPLGLRSERNYG